MIPAWQAAGYGQSARSVCSVPSGRAVWQRQEGSEMTDGHLPDEVAEPNWQALVPVALELRRWVDRLPEWFEASGETWQTSSRRLGKQVLELAERLRQMPGSTVARSPNGSTIALMLAGVEAKVQGRLAAACRNWVAKAQRADLGRSGTSI
jgi:hypothetical protein